MKLLPMCLVSGCRIGGWTHTFMVQRMTSNTDCCGEKSILQRKRVRYSCSSSLLICHLSSVNYFYEIFRRSSPQPWTGAHLTPCSSKLQLNFVKTQRKWIKRKSGRKHTVYLTVLMNMQWLVWTFKRLRCIYSVLCFAPKRTFPLFSCNLMGRPHLSNWH